MDNILYGMENQDVSNVLALDLSAAFNTVQHHIMQQTFNNYYGLSGKVLDWIGSYLSNRSCMVLVGNDYSEKKGIALVSSTRKLYRSILFHNVCGNAV